MPHELAVPYSRSALEREQIAKAVHGVFKKVAADVARQLRKQSLEKAAGEVDLDEHLVVNLSGLDDLAIELPEELASAYKTAEMEAIAIVGGDTRGEIVNLINERAQAYAKERAAELVGRRWVNGELVDNPLAEWAISDSTRNMLNDMVGQALDEGWGMARLADAIEESVDDEGESVFSEGRARMIARTETIDAHSEGTLEGYYQAKEAGVHVKKQWWPDAECCEVCQENADAGPIDLDDDFPSGDSSPTAHPNCECVLIPYVEDGGEDDDVVLD